MTQHLPFRALLVSAPWSVVAFDAVDGFTIWKPTDWQRHRGKRQFFKDVEEGWAIRVDHLEFDPAGPPGLGVDCIGRTFARFTMLMIAVLIDGHDVDKTLRRCFEAGQARRINAALLAIKATLDGAPLSMATDGAWDAMIATIGHTPNGIAVR